MNPKYIAAILLCMAMLIVSWQWRDFGIAKQSINTSKDRNTTCLRIADQILAQKQSLRRSPLSEEQADSIHRLTADFANSQVGITKDSSVPSTGYQVAKLNLPAVNNCSFRTLVETIQNIETAGGFVESVSIASDAAGEANRSNQDAWVLQDLEVFYLQIASEN